MGFVGDHGVSETHGSPRRGPCPLGKYHLSGRSPRRWLAGGPATTCRYCAPTCWCARVGARSAGSAWGPLLTDGAAGDRDLGGVGRDARLRWVRLLGSLRAGGGVGLAGSAVSPAQREDVSVGVLPAGRHRSGPSAGDLLRRAGRRRGPCCGRVAGRGVGWQNAARCPPWRHRPSSSGGVSPTAPGWCWASSLSRRRATKSPAYGGFRAHSADSGCWSRWTRCTLRGRPRNSSARP